MKVDYRNILLARAMTVVSVVTAAAVAATFMMLFGFREPPLHQGTIYLVQVVALAIFIVEKAASIFNAASPRQWLRVYWFEIPLLLILAVTVAGAGRWYYPQDISNARQIAIGAYLFFQMLSRISSGLVNLAAAGRSPTTMLIATFLMVILAGTGMLLMPRATVSGSISLVDALFTATSATCVTGLVVHDTGSYFTREGQIIILAMMQLGGLGIIIFGAVFSLMVRQAFTLREQVAMKDLLSSENVIRIGHIIAFIFITTLLLEGIGAAAMYNMWSLPEGADSTADRWFYSVFHSVSAFCNAGFGLYSDSLVSYSDRWQVYGVFAILIILGGLGFTVLYNVAGIIADRMKRLACSFGKPADAANGQVPRRLALQSKIAIAASAVLVVGGMLLIAAFERYSLGGADATGGIGGRWADAFFQSVTARTAGFSTVEIGRTTPATRLLLIILMIIGGSPGSAAGGIKTVTVVLLLMVIWTTFRKRGEVEIFGRSIRLVVVGRAITIAVVYLVVLVALVFALSLTERNSGFEMSDVAFEAASALGTVGLSTGITDRLSVPGRLLLTAAMLIGRLGPMTLVASLTFNLKPVRYNYPEEAVMVG